MGSFACLGTTEPFASVMRSNCGRLFPYHSKHYGSMKKNLQHLARMVGSALLIDAGILSAIAVVATIAALLVRFLIFIWS